jgi:DNA polymerase
MYLETIGIEYMPGKIDNIPDGCDEIEVTGPKFETLQQLRDAIGDCRRCQLSEGRSNIVFGDGNPDADLVFVGEAPGRDEDIQGEPFVGKAGQLLTRIINAMGLTREDVYICNVIKCRPPNNRDPLPSEIAMCEPFLKEQLDIIKPRVICALGSFASQTLLKSEVRISRLRGQLRDYYGVPLMPTYHPSFLLRNPQAKREVWEDIQQVMKLLGLPFPRHDNY